VAHAHAQDIVPVPRGSPLRAELLNAARPTFQREIGGDIEFVVRRLNTFGEWAYGEVTPQRSGGQPIDWRRTKFAEDDKAGAFEASISLFLLRRSDRGTWLLVEYAIGPTDIAWDSWREQLKLPRELFER
jgi:hypothetical protein